MSSTLSDLSEIQFLHPTSISKHLECPICQVYFTNPFRLNCGHTFCKLCIEGLKKSLKPFQALTCPTCREIIDIRYVSADLIACHLIEEQIVFCLNKKKYCGWKGQLMFLENHLMECTFKEYDNVRQQLFEMLDQGVKQAVQVSDLNAFFSFQYEICKRKYIFLELILKKDEKLQENINKNVGESLLVRLMNKDIAMAQDIAKQISQAERNDLKQKSKIIKETSKESDDLSNCIIELKEELIDLENHNSCNNEDNQIIDIISIGETKSEVDETNENQNSSNKINNLGNSKCFNVDNKQKQNTMNRQKNNQKHQRKQIVLEKNQTTLDLFLNIKQDYNAISNNVTSNLLKDNTNKVKSNIVNNDSNNKNQKESKSRQSGKRRIIKSTLPMLIAPLAQFRQFEGKEYDDIYSEDEEGFILI